MCPLRRGDPRAFAATTFPIRASFSLPEARLAAHLSERAGQGKRFVRKIRRNGRQFDGRVARRAGPRGADAHPLQGNVELRGSSVLPAKDVERTNRPPRAPPPTPSSSPAAASPSPSPAASPPPPPTPPPSRTRRCACVKRTIFPCSKRGEGGGSGFPCSGAHMSAPAALTAPAAPAAPGPQQGPRQGPRESGPPAPPTAPAAASGGSASPSDAAANGGPACAGAKASCEASGAASGRAAGRAGARRTRRARGRGASRWRTRTRRDAAAGVSERSCGDCLGAGPGAQKQGGGLRGHGAAGTLRWCFSLACCARGP